MHTVVSVSGNRESLDNDDYVRWFASDLQGNGYRIRLYHVGGIGVPIFDIESDVPGYGLLARVSGRELSITPWVIAPDEIDFFLRVLGITRVLWERVQAYNAHRQALIVAAQKGNE